MTKPILCLDFDGVIHSYTSGWKGAAVIPDVPVPGAFSFIKNAGEHFDVAIYSSRSHQDGGIAAMINWLIKHGLPQVALCKADQVRYLGEYAEDIVQDAWHHTVSFPLEKPPAMVSIDDRALRFTGIWPEVPELLDFKPWNKR